MGVARPLSGEFMTTPRMELSIFHRSVNYFIKIPSLLALIVSLMNRSNTLQMCAFFCVGMYLSSSICILDISCIDGSRFVWIFRDPGEALGSCRLSLLWQRILLSAYVQGFTCSTFGRAGEFRGALARSSKSMGTAPCVDGVVGVDIRLCRGVSGAGGICSWSWWLVSGRVSHVCKSLR